MMPPSLTRNSRCSAPVNRLNLAAAASTYPMRSTWGRVGTVEPDPHIVHKLDVRPWSCEDDRFVEVSAIDVIEHVATMLTPRLPRRRHGTHCSNIFPARTLLPIRRTDTFSTGRHSIISLQVTKLTCIRPLASSCLNGRSCSRQLYSTRWSGDSPTAGWRPTGLAGRGSFPPGLSPSSSRCSNNPCNRRALAGR